MPKYTQPGKTWQYSNEFKVKAVQLSLSEGILVQEIATSRYLSYSIRTFLTLRFAIFIRNSQHLFHFCLLL